MDPTHLLIKSNHDLLCQHPHLVIMPMIGCTHDGWHGVEDDQMVRYRDSVVYSTL